MSRAKDNQAGFRTSSNQLSDVNKVGISEATRACRALRSHVPETASVFRRHMGGSVQDGLKLCGTERGHLSSRLFGGSAVLA